MIKKMLHTLVVIAIFYGIIVVFFYLFQSGFLFFPQPLQVSPALNKNVEEVEITTSGGNVLHGWLCHTEEAGPQKLIIYFGGNAEEVSHMIPMAPLFEGWALLLVNYPGYGKSEGKPGQKKIFDAALAIYDYAAAREDINGQRIVVMGRSIGTGPAVYLAHERATMGAILVSPFESITAVARSKMPFLPVSLILRHRFPSKKYAANIITPMIAFYGTDDNIIPPRHSKRLAGSWKGNARLVQLESFGHNDIFESREMWEEMGLFLKELVSDQK